MWNDFKRGFWYSIGAIFGVFALQTVSDKIAEMRIKKEKKDEEDSE